MSVFLTGTGGNVVWAGTGTTMEVGITSWTVEASVALVDITSVDDTTWRKFTTGRIDWTATVDTLDAGANPAAVNEAAASLTLGDGVSGSNLALAKAICTGISINTGQDDVVRTTFSFVCAGAI
jgi:hypothetical protein